MSQLQTLENKTILSHWSGSYCGAYFNTLTRDFSELIFTCHIQRFAVLQLTCTRTTDTKGYMVLVDDYSKNVGCTR